MAEELIEIILQAVDNASSIFSNVTQSAEEIGTTMSTAGEEASAGFDEIDESASTATGTIQDVIDYCQNIDGSGPREAASGMNELESATSTADTAVEDLGTDLDIINAGMMLQTAEQISAIAGNAESMAQEMNTAAISVGQLATQTGVAEPQMVELVNTISNATFPNDEAMMYIKSLDQMGVSSQNLGESATNIDRINDAFGLGAQTTNSLAQELGVLGVDMNNVSSAFNALAYANANTVGGMNNYYTFLRKYDAEFKQLGFDVDQSSIIIAAATQKYGGGKAALSGLSDALKEADGDTRKLEEALGIQAGTLDHASEVTGQYEGQLQDLASEEAEHKTLLDQLGAAWEDVSMSLSGVLSPLGSAVGLIGEVGSFGMQVNGLMMLSSTLKSVVSGIRDFNLAKTMQNVLEGEGAIASLAGALGITTEAAAAEGATVAFGGLAVAEGAALWPILAIIAAIGLLVVAVYEIGKSFGWWKDVGTMFEAIQAGVQRLWSAFINHPDVQAIISTITSAWDTFTSAVGWAWNELLKFFGVATGGEFDIVRAIIDGLGLAWEAVTLPMRTVFGLFELLYPYLMEFYESCLVPLGEFLGGVFAEAWTLVGELINFITPYVTALTDAFTQFMNGQISLPDLILSVLTTLWNLYSTITTQIITLVWNWGSQLLTNALQAGSNFVSGVISFIQTLPARVLVFLVRTATYITNQARRWVEIARQKASQLVTGVISFITQLPGKVYSGLISVVDRISSAIQSWINTASQKVSQLIKDITSPFSGVEDTISSALSGVVDTITAPFKQAWEHLEPIVSKIQDAMSIIGGSGGDAAGGLAAGGFETEFNTVQEIETIPIEYQSPILETEDSEETVTVEFKDDLDLNINIDGLPDGVSTDDVLELFRKFFNDPNFKDDFIRYIVGSSLFQKLDNKAKTRLLNKGNRARGV